MLYKVYKMDGQECVHKLDGDQKGEKKHCYSGPTAHASALAYMRALYQAEGDTKEVELIDKELGDLGLETKEIEDLAQKCMSESYVPWGIKSWEELDAYRKAQDMAHEIGEATYDFTGLVNSIMVDPEMPINEKVNAVKAVADGFQERVVVEPEGEEEKELSEEDYVELLDDPELEPIAQVVPDDGEKAKRSDVSAADRKRAVAEYGNVKYADPTNKKYPIDSESHIRAAWNYINKPKNAAKYGDSGASVKRKIVAAWKKKIDPKGPPSAKKELGFDEIVTEVVTRLKGLLGIKDKGAPGGFMVYKEVDGSYRWIARYSNNFRDQDNPPEIISSKSHEQFVEKVEKGLAPLPELWIWHVKEWRIGVADWVTYDKSGFAVAGGKPLPGMEPAFDHLATVKEIKVSHGMPITTIVRDPDDETIIIEHETREISPLPAWAAANKLTGFVVLDAESKEASMAIPADKRDTLKKDFGFSEDLLTLIEAQNAKDAEKAKDEGLEHKETDAVAETAVTEPVTETKPVDEPPVQADLAAQLQAAVAPLIDKLNALEGEIKALKEKEQQGQKDAMAQVLKDTPAAAILSMFGHQVKSAIGAEETRVDGRTELAKQGPAKPTGNSEGRTLVPFINEILAGVKPSQQA